MTEQILEKRTREQLLLDLIEIVKMSHKKGYIFTHEDAFALGYAIGKVGGLSKIFNNEDAIMYACDEYDKTDDLGLLDTVSETLMDLEIVPRRL